MQMVRKTIESQKDWDQYLPLLLFTCREAPSSATGYSPFELFKESTHMAHWMFLRHQRMPTHKTPKDAADWILHLRDMLSEMRNTAVDNQQSAKDYSKRHHDAKAQDRSIAIGDKVLVFSPVITGCRPDKLSDCWQGPYEVLGKVSPVTYLVHMLERHKQHRRVHIEAMKLWIELTLPIHYLRPETEPHHDLPGFRHAQVVLLDALKHSLNSDHLTELKTLLLCFETVIDPKLSRTHLTTHKIVTGDALPIALPYYRCPEARKSKFLEELSYLRENNFVEDSTSPWAAPMFPIPKKDGSIHLVVHYRRLNQVTEADPYTMPRVEVLLEQMGHAHLFTTLDLRKGYYQVPDPVHVPKTALSPSLESSSLK